MKKIFNKSTFLGIIIGTVIASIIGVSAATLVISCNADQVSYEAGNSKFNVENVKDALDTLYQYDSEIAKGSFTATTTAQTITVGFRPSKIVIYISKTNYTRVLIYDTSISATKLLSGYQTGSSGADLLDFSTFGFSITSTGFTYKSENSTSADKTYYYAIR